MGYVSKYRGIDIDQAIEFAKENADINEKLSKKAEALHTHSLSDITGLTDLKVSWENITGKPEVFPCDGSCGGSGENSGNNGGDGGGVITGTVSWGNITGKPTTFAPSAHTHVITDLSNIGDLKIDWSNIVNKPENIGTGGGSVTLTWENIQNKPTVFTPETHRHHASEIDGLELGGNGGTISWDNILEKPDLASKIHKHSISDINGLEDRLTYIEEKAESGSGSSSGNSGGDYSEIKNKVQLIENDVENLQSQVEIVQGGYNIVQGSVMSLQTTVGSIQSSNLDLKGDVLENKTDIANLKTSVKSIENSISNSTNWGTEISNIKQSIGNLASVDTGLSNRITEIDNKTGNLTTEVSEVKKSINTFETTVKNAQDAITEMQETIDQFTGDFSDQLDGALAGSEFGARLDNIESIAEGNAGSIEEINSTISEFQDNLSEIEVNIEKLNDDLNDHYYIWQGEDDIIPDLSNEPAIQWVTVTDKRSHIGDFYINSEGYCFKFVEDNKTFKWIEIQDRYIVPYAKQIDSKSTIFIKQPNENDSYKPGDLWINATFVDNGNEVYSSETLVCIEEKLKGEEFDINHWESTNYASINDIQEVSNSLIKYQRRVILEKKSDLFKEETWIENGEPWIYNGVVISVIGEQKLYLLINKDRYKQEDAWVEIGKTISLTWSNITEKPEFLETIEGNFEALKSDVENLTTIVEDNQSSLIDRIETIENESLVEIENTISGLDELLSDHYYIWQGEDDIIPDLSNEPAIQWTNDSLKRSHVGDFYINSLGYCYKFVQEGKTYKWVEVEDRYIVPYARQISSKSTIFVQQPTISNFYKPGDLWINATYYETGIATPLFYEANLVCVEGKEVGDEFDISHWELSTLSSTRELSNLEESIERNKARVIINNKSQLFKEETWLEKETGQLWIYEGLVISVIADQKLYLLVNKERYQYEDAWIEIGKTLSLTWSNIDEKPEFLETIDSRVDELESEIQNFNLNLNDNVADITERLNSLENENIPELEYSIESINEILSEHYYIWQGDDDTVPELTNDPAIQWTTDSLKRSHVGDFYINSLGYCYKFIQEKNTYKWIEVSDRYIVPYAKRIAGKSTIFISQPSEEDLYSPGDIWLNATYEEGGINLFERVTLVCIEGKEEGEEFDINHWEEASIVDKELEGIDKKIENYRTRIILTNKSQLYKEETWLTDKGDLWIYNGLVVSVINDQKLYLLIDKEKYQYEDSWIEIGKTLSLTWDNITDKPDLSPSDHIHQNYEEALNTLDDSVYVLQEDMTQVQETLNEYDLKTLPKIEENLSEINSALVGQFYIWHGSDNEPPSMYTVPEIDWITTEDKKSHLGDFYLTMDGKCYKYIQNNKNAFEWALVSDRYIISYADKINYKSTIFTKTPTEEESYKPGDIWVNAVYSDELGNRVFNNDITICIVEKAEGEAFNWADWQPILKADEVNIDNTTVTVGANQYIKGHKTFGVPIYFGEQGTGPERDEEAYKKLYSSLYDDLNNNFTLEAGKRASTNDVKTLNIKNTTAGDIIIKADLTNEFKEESSKSGSIEVVSTYGGDIRVFSSNDRGKQAGNIYIQTKSGKNDLERDDVIGFSLNSETRSALIFNQDTGITENLCKGYAEMSGFKGLAITSKAENSMSDMTGVRFRWDRTDADGNEINTLDIHKVQMNEGEVEQSSLSIKVNGTAEVLTSANFTTYLESAEGNIIDFTTGFLNDPDEMIGAVDVSDKLQKAFDEAISTNSKLVIKFGTYLVNKSIQIKSLDEAHDHLIVEANNSLFLCGKDIISNKANYGGTLPNGGTRPDDLTATEVESKGSLFIIGTNPLSGDEDKKDQGTFELRNARIKCQGSVRSQWIAFDIRAQRCVYFDRVYIENMHTGFKINRCRSNTPFIKRCKLTNLVFGIHSIGGMLNFSITDTEFNKCGTGIYIAHNSTGDFANNTISHCTFDSCNQGIYGHSRYATKAIRIKCNKFNSNKSFDIFLKNRINYPSIDGVTFTDISQNITNSSGQQEAVVIPWTGRANIPINIPEGFIMTQDTALPSELSNVSPEESSIGTTHTATWTKTSLNWGDSNISITDNIFYDCHGVQIGNDKNGGHVSGVQFSGNRIEGEIENCIKICSDLDGNCSAVSIFNNSYQSTITDKNTGDTISINFEVPVKSALLSGTDYMPSGGVQARYSTGPVCPITSLDEEGQIGDLRWDETKAYLKTETGWKVIQFTHAFDNESTAKSWKPLETSAQEPTTFTGYNIGDIVWNVDGNSEKLGWRLIKDAAGVVKWRRIEELIRSFLGS